MVKTGLAPAGGLPGRPAEPLSIHDSQRSDPPSEIEVAVPNRPKKAKRQSILDVEFGFDDVDGFDGMTTIAESGGREGRSRSLWKLSASPSARESTVHERHEQTRVCHNCRRQLVRVLNSWPMQTILLALILVDIGLTIFQIVMDIVDPDNANEIQWMFALTMTIVSILLVEVCLRIWGLGVRAFFAAWFNTLDLTVSVISLALELIVYAAYEAQLSAIGVNGTGAVGGGDLAAANNFAALRVLRPAARILRACRVTTRVVRQHGQMQTTARHVVGGNKRRYQRDGFDLDLVYITDQLIGMSVPAIGPMSLYRNPIEEVARFFNKYHADDGFMLLNCTSEYSYPEQPFGGRVRRYIVDDHNVPPMETVVEFCEELARLQAAKPSTVFAVHCRGGKGRTGTMCCAWLLWTRHCATAAEALSLFEERRTDERIRGKKQGVETESQKRYVNYVEQYLAIGKKLAPQPRQVHKLALRNLLPDGYRDVPMSQEYMPWVVISQFGPLGKTSLDTKSGSSSVTRCVRQEGTDLVFDLRGLSVCGDLKIELFCDKSSGVTHLEEPPQREIVTADGKEMNVLGESGKRQSALPSPLVSPGNSLRFLASAKALTPGSMNLAAAGPGPPAPGADRQLVLYAWLHTSFDPGSDATIVLPLSSLDRGGKECRPLFKKLKERGLRLELEFDLGSTSRQPTPATAAAGASSGKGGSAALERARAAASGKSGKLSDSFLAGAATAGDAAGGPSSGPSADAEEDDEEEDDEESPAAMSRRRSDAARLVDENEEYDARLDD